MSGHNKWSKIKHKKAATDAKKSKEFGKLSRLITVEAKKSSGNLDSPGLKMVIEKARKANMPSENIEKAIKKATEAGAGADEEITYELYGPGGVAVVVEVLTDNRNRTAAEVKHLLSKFDLELAKPGAATWAFEKANGDWQAKTSVAISDADKEKLEVVVESLEDHDDVSGVFTNVEKP